MIPLIAIIDPSYVGYEGIQDEVGSDYAVEAVASFGEAQLRLAATVWPIVVVPETLEPEPGRVVLERLKAAGHQFVGLLMVDEAAALPRFGPDSAVTHIAFRPLRNGEFRRHVDAAAASRETLIRAHAAPANLIAAIATAIRRLEAGSAFDRAIAHELILASRPLEATFVDPVGLIAEAFHAASQRHPAASERAPILPAPPQSGRHPRVEVDGRAMLAALTELLIHAFAQHPDGAPQIEIGLEPSREADRDGWLITIDDDGEGATPAMDAASLVESASPTAFGLALAARVVLRHGGQLSVERMEGQGGRTQLWLPELRG